MKLVVNMIMSTMLEAYSEGLALADSAGLELDQVTDVVNSGGIKGRVPGMRARELSARAPECA